MTVVDLSSKRLERQQRTTCSGCGPAQLCYPHRLEALAARLRDGHKRMDEELFVVSGDVDALVSDVLTVLDGICNECLPPTSRALSGYDDERRLQ